MELTLQELERRRAKFTAAMNVRFPDWDTAVIAENVNQYYFTGTIQNGLLLIYKDGSCLYGVRRSYERAKEESPLGEIIPITGYRDMAGKNGGRLGNVYVEGDTLPMAVLERLKKYFEIGRVNFLDTLVRTVRSVKSPCEIHWIKQSGEQHRILLEERVPALLREGMSEAEFTGELLNQMYQMGYHGLTRLHQSPVELTAGQLGFGTNSLYPSSFDGPGGGRGGGPANPMTGDHRKRLKRGDPVFVDTPFGLRGYHTDKTQVYMFGATVPEELAEAHRFCREIQNQAAARLKPGEIPSQIYQDIIAGLSEKDLDHFMGVDNKHRVKFLGHGVGLNIDELPVIAKGFDEPLEENMVIALEPKKGVPGIGMAGVEETYIVTPAGGQCVTGGGREIVRIV
ncbi:MAG: M24 family metallopeptidase [Treponema sp.]|jgi:Xaa-Pro aminopeptidase|nr:M24 family metallopeptidase [Treponema sp.]